MTPFDSRRILYSALLLVVAVGTAAPATLAQPADDDFFALQKNFEIFGAMFESLVGSYVDPIDAERLMRRGFSAMLDELDPYTVFLDESDYTAANVNRAGQLGTVGLDADFRDGRFTVLSPVNGGAAFRQGVRVGDVITSVAGRATAVMTHGDIFALLTGDPGSLVEVHILRPGEELTRVFQLPREIVRTDPVSHAEILFEDPAAAVGYVRLSTFSPGSAERVRSELVRLNDATPLKGVILDLRDNQGGLLEDAVSILQLFVPSGSPVVSLLGRRPENTAEYETSGTPLFPDTPLAVLINRRSASASEIVAGAVQDLDRGVIVGETSFGKGIAQTVTRLPFNTGVKITTSRFYSPSGRNIQSANYRLAGAATPDSLRGDFATSNGRPVKGGGGIDPDVTVQSAVDGPLLEVLRQGGHLFRYADEQTSAQAAITSPAEIDMTAFAQWLATEQITFETRAEVLLRELRTALDGGEEQLVQLAEIVNSGKQAALDRESDAIRRALFDAISARFVTNVDEQYRVTLPHDPVAAAAAEVIADARRYAALLGH